MPPSPERIPPLNDPLLRQVPTIAGHKVLGKSVLAWRLGAGGMGIVWRGWHLDFNIPVAIKAMQPEIAEDADYVQRFRREAEAALRITHQNVVRVHDVEERFGLNFLVMEFVDGESVSQRIARVGPLGVAEAATVLTATAAGLAEAHMHGLIHGDVKPDNVLISHHGRVKLADLGLVRPTADSDSEPTRGKAVILGSRKYMAPETWTGATPTPAADIWALGATAYFLLTGRHGVPDMPRKEVGRWLRDHDYPTLDGLTPPLPPALAQILEKCVHRDPQQRFANGDALYRALRALGLQDEHLLRRAELADAEAVQVPTPATLAKIREEMERPVLVTPRRRPMPQKKGVHPAVWLTAVVAGAGALAIALTVNSGPSADTDATTTRQADPPKPGPTPTPDRPIPEPVQEPARPGSSTPAEPTERQKDKPASTPTPTPTNPPAPPPDSPPAPDVAAVPGHKGPPIARGSVPRGCTGVEVQIGAQPQKRPPVTNGTFEFDLPVQPDIRDSVVLTAIYDRGRRSQPKAVALTTLYPPPRIELLTPAIGVDPGTGTLTASVKVHTFLPVQYVRSPGIKWTSQGAADFGSSTWTCTLAANARGAELTVEAADAAGNPCSLQTAPLGVDLSGKPLTSAAGTVMRWIPPAEFEFKLAGRSGMAPTPCKIQITHGWWIAETEVTNEQWQKFANDYVIAPGEERFAVTDITWTQAKKYCQWLTERERESGRLPADHEYWLPTEPYWVLAAKERQPDGPEVAAIVAAMFDGPVATGQESTNEFGVRDMLRGVREWCNDITENLSDTRVNVNPCFASNELKAIRGAAWSDLWPSAESWREKEDYKDPRVGLRVALRPPVPSQSR